MHSVAVARQYCGMLGTSRTTARWAVSVSLACAQGSLPVAWQLYLPEDWAQDAARRKRAGVPEALGFATKTQIALQQLRTLLYEGAPRHCVLADAGYGVGTAFRQRVSEMGLPYAVGITSAVLVWPLGVEPLPPEPYSGRGRPLVMPRRTAELPPMSCQGPGAVLAGAGVPDDHLARRNQRAVEQSVHGSACSPCGWQRRQGASAPTGVVAHRMA